VSASTDTWSAAQYLAFEEERTRPVRDLLAAVPPIDARRVIDLGCGPGNSTEVLARRFPHARATGIDSSADMIEAARRRLPEIDFQVRDLREWADAPAAAPEDVILSNAVLQWVPGHARLLGALVARLAPGGVLALQLPDNLTEPAQRLMREVAAAGPWSARLTQAEEARVPIESAEWYHERLAALGARVQVWRTTYYHALRGAEAIVEWFRGTGLRPYLDPLSPPERERYLERYRERVADSYPARADGTVLLPFPRLFLLAQRP
jgi:trans-aconitate 2-methyltransferase